MAPKLGARVFSLSPWLGLLALGVGCYSTVPHKAEVATPATARACSNAVVGVFARSGFIQLPTPPNLSMFFAARVSGPYDSFLRTGTGVGVTVNNGTGLDEEDGLCRVTIQALSPDSSCLDAHPPLGCSGATNLQTNERVLSPGFPSTGSMSGTGATTAGMVCAVPPLTCALSYAPGADNDAAVDELARRVKEALGPRGSVSLSGSVN